MLKPRRKTKTVFVGSVAVGGEHPISIQSMTSTKTADIKQTLEQISVLTAAGCDICRVAVPDMESAEKLHVLVANSRIPLIADIHFDYRLAIKSAEQGIHGLRLNPGNIGSSLRVRQVAQAAKAHGIPIRIGVNAGSIKEETLTRHGGPTAGALVETVLNHISLLEKEGFFDIKISLKSSDVLTTLDAYRLISKECDYPLHIGLTEAGLPGRGVIRSAITLGVLLSEGIGDTVRVSLTADPVEEVYAAREILNALALSSIGYDLVSCPMCGRAQVDVIAMANMVKSILDKIEPSLVCGLKIAVMGCTVNGPGEARHADFGIAGGKKSGLLFARGEVIGKYSEADLAERLAELILSEQLKNKPVIFPE